MEEKANASKIFSELIEKTTYEDLDDVPVGDIEYDITETLKASKELTIDQSGKWFYEGRRV